MQVKSEPSSRKAREVRGELHAALSGNPYRDRESSVQARLQKKGWPEEAIRVVLENIDDLVYSKKDHRYRAGGAITRVKPGFKEMVKGVVLPALRISYKL